MRPIKFRVWDKKTKEFVKGDMFFEQEDQGTFEPDCYHDEAGEVHSMKYSQKKLDRYHGYIIQQYTGLNDYKGKEIYEGDILDIFNHPQPEEVIYCSSETAFGFFAHEEKERQNGRFESLGDYTSPSGYTVIGNIFETPQLLDKPKEL